MDDAFIFVVRDIGVKSVLAALVKDREVKWATDDRPYGEDDRG